MTTALKTSGNERIATENFAYELYRSIRRAESFCEWLKKEKLHLFDVKGWQPYAT